MSAVPSVPFSMTTKSGRICGIYLPLRLSFLFFFSLFLIFYDERSNIQSLSSDWKLERRYLLGRGKVFHFIIFFVRADMFDAMVLVRLFAFSQFFQGQAEGLS